MATGGAMLAAQAVERTDVPGRGVLRVTFDPRIMTWDAEFVNGTRLRLDRVLTGDTLGSTYIPVIGQLEQDVRVATRSPGFIASLGAGVFSLRQERRTLPFTAEFGVTRRLAVSVTVPFVRVSTRASLALSSRGANLGLNPLLQGVANAGVAYTDFFTQFDTTLARLDANIAAGMYSCPPAGGGCEARDSSAAWHAVRDALHRTVYGVGQTHEPFMPLDTSDAGRAIAGALAQIQQALATTYAVPGFANGLLLPVDTMRLAYLTQAIIDPNGFGYFNLPFQRNFRWWIGDVEVATKYRLVDGAHYAAALVALARLPTGGRDSADEWLRQSIGDHQTDLEGRVIQELIMGPLWLNVAVRAGMQRPGTRVRRVGPLGTVLLPFEATTELAWDPGDYLGVDVAPLLRLAPQLALGVTAGYWTTRRDHYSFRSTQDSVDLATRLGAPTSAALLDAGTAVRQVRLGAALTYMGPRVEGGLSIEQTVSGSGVTPAAALYRIVLRVSRKLF